MTLRSIQWITDSGLLVGLTTIGEFTSTSALAALSLSASSFTLTEPAGGAILGTTPGSAITAAGLPAGLTITASQGWAYDGSGAVGSYVFTLTETLSGASNSPFVTSILVTVSALGVTLDFSQSTNSGLIAITRSF